MDDDTETYILLLLADGNLPTGSFVASSGLESYIQHGFFSPIIRSSQALANESTIDFMQNSLQNYARSALPFVSDAHIAVSGFKAYMEDTKCTSDERAAGTSDLKNESLRRILALDSLYETSTLNKVTLRASKAQGVAQLSLYSKGFSNPTLPTTSSFLHQNAQSISYNSSYANVDTVEDFVEEYRRIIRRGESHGHLPVCWGILTAAIGLSLERSQYLHLFLQARSLISASVRLNTIGPYAAQQILFHVVRQFVIEEVSRCKDLRTGLQFSVEGEDGEVIDYSNGSATTWPLGEIIAARHDLLHSRVFNS